MDLIDYQDKQIARARRTDPSTSHDAAASVTSLTDKQAAVLEILRRLGGQATDHTIERRYEASHDFEEGFPRQSSSGLRTRRSELVARGLIYDGRLRERLPSGRLGIVWTICENADQLSDAGRRQFDRRQT